MYAAREALGDNVLAVTVRTPSYPGHEARDAAQLLRELKIPHFEIGVDQLAVPGFAENGPERCYYCKRALFETVVEMAGMYHCSCVADGSNIDDEGDYRPGMKAIAELGIKSPFREVGLTKEEVRLLSREFELFTWNKPSYACLASRIPYGEVITAEKLQMIEAAEQILLDLGLPKCVYAVTANWRALKLLSPLLKNCAAAAAPEDRGSFQEGGVPVCKFRSGRVSQRQYE